MQLAPPREKLDDVKYMFAKSLPYTARLTLVVGAMVFGVIVQLTFNFWIGLALLFAGTALSMIKGYDAKPVKEFGSQQWGQVTPDEFTKVKAKAKELRSWDRDMFDATNPLGVATLVLLFAFAAIVEIMLVNSSRPELGLYWGLDCFVVLLLHWFTGTRDYLTNDKLIININMLEKVMAALKGSSDIQVLPMLATSKTKTGKDIPDGAKLMLKFLNAPSYFLGVQVQTSINTVQGADLPYLYAVILYRRGSKLLDIFPLVEKELRSKYGDGGGLASFLGMGDDPVLMEPKSNEDVDIIVVRQLATKTKGYSTTPDQALRVVRCAAELSFALLKHAVPEPPAKT